MRMSSKHLMIDITTWLSHYHQTGNIFWLFDCPELKVDEDKEVLSNEVIYGSDIDKIRRVAPGLSTTGLLTSHNLVCSHFSRLAQASVQVLYNVLSSPVVLSPGLQYDIWVWEVGRGSKCMEEVNLIIKGCMDLGCLSVFCGWHLWNTQLSSALWLT